MPASEESFTSAGIGSSTTGNSEKEPSNDQHKMRSFTDAGAGSDSPSESQWPLPHAKSSTGTQREGESKVALVTQPPWPGGRSKEDGVQFTPGDSLSSWPGVRTSGVMYVVYTVVGVKSNAEDDDYWDGLCIQWFWKEVYVIAFCCY